MNQSTNDTTSPEELPDHKRELRSDLWTRMTPTQLNDQRDIVITKLANIQGMIGLGSVTPTLGTIYHSLQLALSDLNRLLDNHS